MAAEGIVTRVRPPLRPIGPAFQPLVLRLVHTLLPLLLRFRLFPWLPAGLTRIEVVNGDALARCWARFARGEVRLILAFRHGEVDDPLPGLYLLARDLPRRARRLGLALPRPLHAHFLFDRGMPLWGGWALGGVLARLGGISVRRGRHPDWTALRQARRLVLEGPLPFALAPEGATNGHGEVIGPLEPGVAQLGLWCVEDLERAGRREEVLIVPVALQYAFARPDWRRLGRLLGRLEHDLGLPPPEGPTLKPTARLHRVGTAFLEALEGFYATFPPTPTTPAGAAGGADPDPIQRLVERALAVAEARLGGNGTGTVVDRCRRLEEAAWSRIHREDLPPRRRLPPLRRGLADWGAHEAALAEVHMRLAECFVAVRSSYVCERPSFERHMETTLLLHDALARLRGDALPARPRLGARQVRVTVGPELSVSRQWQRLTAANPRRTRRAARQLIDALGEQIRQAFQDALV